MKVIADKINDIFVESFGRTPLKERIDDIFRESIELNRYIDVKNLKEEAGDLLCSVIQLCNENDWSPEELIAHTLEKIKRRQVQYKTLGRKTKVILLGGAFNPPHLGHLQAAKALLSYSRSFDECWLVPCNLHLDNKQMESAEHRLAMCRLLVKQDARIKVSSYEIDKQFSGETYHLVKSLMQEVAGDQYEFSMAIGLDNALTFDKWYNYEYLERMIRFVVVPRAGINVDIQSGTNWFLKEPHIFLHPDKPLDKISSTEIREKLAEGYRSDSAFPAFIWDDIKPDLLKKIPEDVYNYIRENNLYRPPVF